MKNTWTSFTILKQKTLKTPFYLKLGDDLIQKGGHYIAKI